MQNLEWHITINMCLGALLRLQMIYSVLTASAKNFKNLKIFVFQGPAVLIIENTTEQQYPRLSLARVFLFTQIF